MRLHESYIDVAPMGAFDGASCLLTLHFLPRAERLETLKQMHVRLRADAPLVVVYHSFPSEGPDQNKWHRRKAALPSPPACRPPKLKAASLY